jgi:hypothetical protein
VIIDKNQHNLFPDIHLQFTFQTAPSRTTGIFLAHPYGLSNNSTISHDKYFTRFLKKSKFSKNQFYQDSTVLCFQTMIRAAMTNISPKS